MSDAYKPYGVPELVSGASNAGDESLAIDNRLNGIPTSAPQTSFVGAMISAWRVCANAAATLIDTVNRKVTTTDDATKIAAFDTAADNAAHTATFTAAEPSKPSSLWTVDDLDELDAIMGGSPAGKEVWYGGIEGNAKSIEALANSLVNKAAGLGLDVTVTANQDAGTVKVASYANAGAQTTACNTLRASPPAAPAVFITHLIPAPVVAASTGPNFGL